MEKLTKVELSNLDKVLFPQLRITKKQIIEYYIRMAPKMLDILADRAMVLTRYPDGITKESFYEKDKPLGTPSWVKTFKRYSETAKRNVNYIVCNNLDTLIWVANLAALEIHVTLSTIDAYENPDLVLFDIDPEPPATINDAAEVAFILKEKLDSLGLTSYVKTSGLKGLHAVIPITKNCTFEQTREFVHQIAKHLVRESEKVVSEFTESKKPGTVFFDYRQNSHGRTMICPYSLRAVAKATVSTPLAWNDINKSLKPEEFNLFNVVKIEKNPWKDLLRNRQKLEVN